MIYSATAQINIRGVSYNLSQSQIKYIEFGTTTRDDNCALNFGVIEQNVTLKFYDPEQHFRRLVADGRDIVGTIIVFENNNTNNSYEINNIEIDETCTQVTLKGIDATRILDDITISKSSIEDRTVQQLLEIFFGYLPEQYDWQYLDGETESLVAGIEIPNSWYRAGTLRQFLDKVCQVGFLNIYHMNSVFYVMRGVV